MSEEKIEESVEKLKEASSKLEELGQMAESPSNKLDLLKDVSLLITVELGRTKLTIQDILQFGQGTVIELEKLAGEALDVYVNGKLIARGEAVVVNEKFGIRITDIVAAEDRVPSSD